MNAALERIRQIRSAESVKLKPSPYLKSHYTDEYGDEHPVSLRNYQAQMIMNMLQVERMLNGEDTGLGKTLEILSVIGYIWMKEPEYVPIIIAPKSSLFQWESETLRFMQGMEAVTVHGKPFERHKFYEDFFLRHDPKKKRLLILTYDMVLYDMQEAVIKEKKRSPRAGFAKELELARSIKTVTEKIFNAQKERFDIFFRESSWEVHNFLADSLNPALSPKPPTSFTEKDALELSEYIRTRNEAIESVEKWKALLLEAAPPKKVPGLIDYVRTMKSNHKNARYILVMDEVHKLKNHRNQFHEKTSLLADECDRVYGLTATPVKNRLMEFFAIFRIICPSLFPQITAFQNQFCVTKLQSIPGGRKVRIVVGYQNLERFVEIVEPFYLSRKKHEVAKELPELISREIECELGDLQEELYDLAELGILNKSEDPDAPSAEVLAAMTMCQQAVDSPNLITNEEGEFYQGPSSKISALIDLIKGEAADQKIIVFSRFEKMISVVEAALKEESIKCTRITGKETNPKVREKNKNTFQDMNSGVNVILITTAGSESLNLRSAEHLAILDLPWSWGDYLQLIGRAIRIGSLHQIVVAHHFIARRQNEAKTIDHHVLKALRSKKRLADRVAGENLQDGLKFTGDVVQDVLADLRESRVSGKATEKVVAKKLTIASKSKPKAPVEEDFKMVDISLDLSDL